MIQKIPACLSAMSMSISILNEERVTACSRCNRSSSISSQGNFRIGCRVKLSSWRIGWVGLAFSLGFRV